MTPGAIGCRWQCWVSIGWVECAGSSRASLAPRPVGSQGPIGPAQMPSCRGRHRLTAVGMHPRARSPPARGGRRRPMRVPTRSRLGRSRPETPVAVAAPPVPDERQNPPKNPVVRTMRNGRRRSKIGRARGDGRYRRRRSGGRRPNGEGGTRGRTTMNRTAIPSSSRCRSGLVAPLARMGRADRRAGRRGAEAGPMTAEDDDRSASVWPGRVLSTHEMDPR